MGVVRVKSGEHQVACESGLDGDLCRGGVANLADGDHLGVLPHERPQSSHQVEAGCGVDLRLGHSGDLDLDGVFQRDQAPLTGGVFDQFAERGVGGGGLPAARGAHNQQQAAHAVEQPTEFVLDVGGEPQVGDQAMASRLLEEADHHLFAMQRGKAADPRLDPGGVGSSHNATLLGHIGAVGEEVREHLEAGCQAGPELGAKRPDGLQHSVNAPVHGQAEWPGDEVNVAGPRFLGAPQHRVDNLRCGLRIALPQGRESVLKERRQLHWRAEWRTPRSAQARPPNSAVPQTAMPSNCRPRKGRASV